MRNSNQRDILGLTRECGADTWDALEPVYGQDRRKGGVRMANAPLSPPKGPEEETLCPKEAKSSSKSAQWLVKVPTLTSEMSTAGIARRFENGTSSLGSMYRSPRNEKETYFDRSPEMEKSLHLRELTIKSRFACLVAPVFAVVPSEWQKDSSFISLHCFTFRMKYFGCEKLRKKDLELESFERIGALLKAESRSTSSQNLDQDTSLSTSLLCYPRNSKDTAHDYPRSVPKLPLDNFRDASRIRSDVVRSVAWTNFPKSSNEGVGGLSTPLISAAFVHRLLDANLKEFSW
uniref:Uncharacterized protein n=1 Tax=Steinernema glaseri TaxID=37863 RepID=A0A1I8AMC3_9BILA